MLTWALYLRDNHIDIIDPVHEKLIVNKLSNLKHLAIKQQKVDQL